jgi:SAM-dependent methyltransferase
MRLCLRLCRRRPLTRLGLMEPSLPPPELLQLQSSWLAPARSRLLRRVEIARRRSVLDLGCGYGAVTGDLVRRSGGPVVSLDRSSVALASGTGFAGAGRVCADAGALPFGRGTFDLVLTQCALMWMDFDLALDEIARVLSSGGAVVAIEPDYGGMMECPAAIAIRDVWLAALRRAGADPEVGRKVPAGLSARGLRNRIELMSEVRPAAAERYDLLRGLPLEQDEALRVARAEASERDLPPAQPFVHLPFVMTLATA